MNKIYKLRLCKARRQLIVVSEISRGCARAQRGAVASPARRAVVRLTLSALATCLLCLSPPLSLAADLPTGGQIIAGQGAINTSGNRMTIHQSSQKLATNWQSFDIGSRHHVQFIQPDSSAVALNRVTGGNPSQIMGTLSANGRVFLVNPAGVIFGKGASVNTAGLVASAKPLDINDFMRGNYTFTSNGAGQGQVINQGSLTTTPGGFIALIGEQVSNQGSLNTPQGKTALAAGDRVTLQLDHSGMTQVNVSGSVVNALVENRGLISAPGGQVLLTAQGKAMLLKTVVNNSGVIEASGFGTRGGEIVLHGGDSGVVSQNGILRADSDYARGGKVIVTGQNIHLAANSRISVRGRTGGGEVYAGGGWQGKDPAIKNARALVMDKGAVIDVSASERGDGGTAVLWSEDYTNFRGTILAKGGKHAGNGGQVETSARRNLQAFGEVDASALKGKSGHWLLDPADVTIVDAQTDTNVTNSNSETGDSGKFFQPGGNDAKISAKSIIDSLNNSNSVTIRTSGHTIEGQLGNITVNATINKTTGGDASLTLIADNNITLNHQGNFGQHDIRSTSGKLNLNLLAGNTTNNANIQFNTSYFIDLNGGDFFAGAGKTGNNISLSMMNQTNIAAGNISLNVSNGLSSYASTLNATHNLTINGSVNFRTGGNVTASLIAGELLNITALSGNVTLESKEVNNETEAHGGAIQLSGKKGVNIHVKNGAFATDIANKDGEARNHVNISSTEGNITLSASTNATDVMNFTRANITAKGHINISAMGGNNNGIMGVNISQTQFTSSEGNIHITGNIGGRNTGLRLAGGNSFTASAGNIILHGESRGSGGAGTNASLHISGNNVFSAQKVTLTGNASGGGTGVKIQDASLSNVEIIGNATAGHGVHIAGNSRLQSTTLMGHSSGDNTTAAVFIEGVLDHAGVIQGNHTGAGTGIHIQGNVRGGTLNGRSASGDGARLTNNSRLAHLELTGNSTSGVGVNISGTIALDHVEITGNTTSGTAGVTINGTLNNSNEDTTITGGNQGAGAGVVLNGSVTNGTINSQSVNGDALRITGDSQLTNGILNSPSDNGTGVNISGNLILTNTRLTGTSRTNGIGLRLNGSLTADNRSQINGMSRENTGVEINGTVTGGLVRGRSTTGIGLHVTTGGTLTRVAASGNSSTNIGAVVNGMLIGSQLSGTSAAGGIRFNGTARSSRLTGTASRGTGLEIADNSSFDGSIATGRTNTVTAVLIGNATLHNTQISGTTGNNNRRAGVNISGTVTNTGDTTITGIAGGNSAGIIVTGNITGGTLRGQASDGIGLDIRGARLINVQASGTSTDSGTGVNISGNNNADSTTRINGESTSGNGINVSGSWQGGELNGRSQSGIGIHLMRTSTLSDTTITGHSASGEPIRNDDASLTNVTQFPTPPGAPSATTQPEPVAPESNVTEAEATEANPSDAALPEMETSGSDVPAAVTPEVETTVITPDTDTVATRPPAPVTPETPPAPPPTPPTPTPPTPITPTPDPTPSAPFTPTQPVPPSGPLAPIAGLLEQFSQQQSRIDSHPQTSQTTGSQPNEPPLPASYYYRPEQKIIDIQLCSGGHCQSLSLDANRPVFSDAPANSPATESNALAETEQ